MVQTPIKAMKEYAEDTGLSGVISVRLSVYDRAIGWVCIYDSEYDLNENHASCAGCNVERPSPPGQPETSTVNGKAPLHPVQGA